MDGDFFTLGLTAQRTVEYGDRTGARWLVTDESSQIHGRCSDGETRTQARAQARTAGERRR